MAGEWIAMSCDLWTSPELVKLSAFCQQHVSAGADRMSARCVVVGALFRIWSIIDVHCAEGILYGYSHNDIDYEVGIPGWCDAMIAVGWLEESSQGFVVPGFEKWFSQSAKRRRMNATYQSASRARRQQTVSSCADKMLTTEEKRTEENIKRKTARASARFVAPTVEEVKTYSEEAGLHLDASKFVDFYVSKDWKVGRNAMKDWKASARNASRDGWCKVGGGGNGQMSADEYKADLARRAKRTSDYVTGRDTP
jgi:hypothetical protein